MLLTLRWSRIHGPSLSPGSCNIRAEVPENPRYQISIGRRSAAQIISSRGVQFKLTSCLASMLPKCPGLEGFKSLPVLFLNPIFCFHPPISKRSTSHGCQSYQVNRLQNGTRELCCKDTQSENVLGCFFLLITERAVLRMRHDSCLQTISRPATRNSENSSLDHLALFSHLHLFISEP